MRDLRKKILLESGKTLSRKARTKQGLADYTPAHSSNNSRATSQTSSRAPSRYASEEEDGASDSEDDDASTRSDDPLDSDHGTAWTERLQSRVEELKTRKRSVQDREDTLIGYIELLRRHFVPEDYMSDYISDIIPALLRGVTAGGSTGERLLAVRAITVTALTYPSETVFDHVFQTLKGLCQDEEEEKVKVEAIHALSVAVLYGGGSTTDYDDILDFFMTIVESDGVAAEAEDSGPVVTAALQAWALVATYVEDLTEQSEQAMDVFMEQLDSTDVNVQTSAGSNIALLFEAARDYEEETGTPMNLQYDHHKISARMSEAVRMSPKSVSRKDRKHLRSSFLSISTSLERGLGPGYSTAGRGGVNPHTGGRKMDGASEFQEFGYREKVRVHDQFITIDTWALQTRVQALKTHLRSGFGVHFLENPLVQEMLESAQVQQVLGPGAAKRLRNAGESLPEESDEPVKDSTEGTGDA